MAKKNVLVTGGAGFIGFHLANSIQKEDVNLTVVDNFSRNRKDEEFEALAAKSNVKFINADMTQKDFLQELDDYYDEIYHLAAINGTKYFYEKPYEVLRVNILALMNLLEWVNEENTGRFLFTSSSEAYSGTITEFGDKMDLVPTKEDVPLSVNDVFNERFSYGSSKLIGEVLVINYFKKVKVDFTVIRYHNIYGPRMGYEHVMPEFVKRLYDNENPFKIFGGEPTRAFCYIDDAVEGTKLSMRSDKTSGEIIHIGNDREEIKIKDLAALLIRLNGSDAELSIEEAPLGSVNRRCPDISKITSLTGYDPKVDLEEGMGLSIKWYMEKFKELDNA